MLLIPLYLVLLIALAVLSYTQVDLNLTLLNWQPYLDIRAQLTQLGYFNRQTNGLIFSAIFAALILFYVAFTYLATQNKFSLTRIKTIVIATALILAFAYSAFSYDIFNYMFDARIMSKYGANPYTQTALNYPRDEWTRFMRWTHRTYPYGPAWLLITIVPSLLGFAKFLPTLLLFKLMFMGFYVLCCYMVYKISFLVNQEKDLVTPRIAVLLFALHPLILVDELISPRIDMAMTATALISVYLYLKATNLRNQFEYMNFLAPAGVALIVSFAVKFVTALLAPVFLISPDKIGIKKWTYLLVALGFAGTLGQIYVRSVQPWYFILPVAFLPLLWNKIPNKLVMILLLACCIPMWIYIYYIYTGISINAIGTK